MKKLHLLIVAIVALSCGFIVAWAIYDSKPIKLEAGVWFGEQTKALPEFSLYDHNNNELGKPQLAGKWNLMFFGFTHCPDICPTSLQTLSEILKAIDDADVRGAIQVIFVSVDPDRDSPALLKSYVQYFHPDFIGASAQISDLVQLTSAIGISHRVDKAFDNQQNYSVAHSAAIVLLNPAVEFAGLFSAPHNSLAIARDLTKIIEHF